LLEHINITQLEQILESGTRADLDLFMEANGLHLQDGKIVAKKQHQADNAVRYWDKRQLVKKINLNSLYGAILNSGCRFFDQRIGQSTTLTGRSITRHMAAKTNELFCGEYDHTGESIIYGDTDSVYFSVVPVMPSDTDLDMESAIKLYDHVSDAVSDTFPDYLNQAFNIPHQAGKVMKAGREVVGQAGLFITKKRYAIKCLDIEGWQPEGGKLKIMGMDIKRSDTPEFIQDFLEELLDDALSGKSEDSVMKKIKDFKQEFRALPSWQKGMPKRVNNLTPYTEKYERIKGISGGNPLQRAAAAQVKDDHNMIPGHVSASIHWNYLKTLHSDQYSMKVTDGAKVIVCRLKNNPLGYSNVAYPTDELQLPDWFKQLPFDDDLMEQSVLDQKIKNVLGAMGWDMSRINQSEAFDEFFEF